MFKVGEIFKFNKLLDSEEFFVGKRRNFNKAKKIVILNKNDYHMDKFKLIFIDNKERCFFYCAKKNITYWHFENIAHTYLEKVFVNYQKIWNKITLKELS